MHRKRLGIRRNMADGHGGPSFPLFWIRPQIQLDAVANRHNSRRIKTILLHQRLGGGTDGKHRQPDGGIPHEHGFDNHC